MQPRNVQRLQGVGQSIFTTMSGLAVRTGAINLGQGFPDKDGPASVIEKAVEAARAGVNQYPPGIGTPTLREAIAGHQQRHYGIELNPATDVVVTTGCTEAIAASILGLVEPGDEVVVIEPYYDSYVAMLQMAGAVRRPVTLHAPDFRLDLDALNAAVTDSTKFLLLNTPHNPTGTVFSHHELQAVADLAIRHDLIVISDEVYEHLVFDDHQHVPIATLPGMFERTLTLSSVGKSWSLTGWKVGWATGPADLVAATMNAKQWLSFTSGAPLQPAVAHALEHEIPFTEQLSADLQSGRDLLCAGLRSAGLDPRVSEGTYFTSTDISHLGWTDGQEFCLALPERAGVVGVPMQAFYDSDAGRHLVRWAFCKESSVIEEGVARLERADLSR